MCGVPVCALADWKHLTAVKIIQVRRKRRPTHALKWKWLTDVETDRWERKESGLRWCFLAVTSWIWSTDVQLMWLMSSNIIFYFLDYKTVKPYMGDISLWDSWLKGESMFWHKATPAFPGIMKCHSEWWMGLKRILTCQDWFKTLLPSYPVSLECSRKNTHDMKETDITVKHHGFRVLRG